MKKNFIDSITWCFQTPLRMLGLVCVVTLILSSLSFNLFFKGASVGIAVLAVWVGIKLLYLYGRSRSNPHRVFNLGIAFIDVIDGTPPADRIEAKKYQARRVFGWFVISSLLGCFIHAQWINNGIRWEQVFEHRGSQLIQILTGIFAVLFGIWFIYTFGKYILSEIFLVDTKKKEKPKPPTPRHVRFNRRP